MLRKTNNHTFSRVPAEEAGGTKPVRLESSGRAISKIMGLLLPIAIGIAIDV